MEKIYIIVDLDDTCFIVPPERQKIVSQVPIDMEAYKKCDFTKDKPNICTDIIEGFMEEYIPVFVTGRSNCVRRSTKQAIMNLFCDSIGVHGYRLLMRRDGDDRPNPIVKKELLIRAGIKPSKVCLAFEDDIEVASMYQELGMMTMLIPKERAFVPEK